MIPSHTLDAFEQHIIDIKDRLDSLPHSESTSNDLNTINHSISRIEELLSEAINDRMLHYKYQRNIGDLLDALISSSHKQVEVLESTKLQLEILKHRLDSIKKNTDILEQDFFDRTFTLFVPALLALILLVLLFK